MQQQQESYAGTASAKIRVVVNSLTFRSDFDSGNLMKVILPAEQNGVGGVYQLWTARDCEGGPNVKRNSSWFHFGVAGGTRNQIITMRLMNLNNQATLYKYGMTPVFRISESGSQWFRLKQKVSFEDDGRYLQLQFQFRFTRDLEEVFFAFCFPHSYDDCQRDLESLEDQARGAGMAVQTLLTPKPGPTGYFHRELLIRTPQGRRVDLVTLTDCHGILDEREPRINQHLFPDLPSGRRPLKFEGKDVVFVSARVHPGETPASFVMQGILRFLLDITDPRSAELRRRFVFKLVPMLNPDGVAAGHFRQDSYGNNLNRHYVDPHPEIHASVFGAKAVVMHHVAQPKGRGKLTLYLDLHAHASARGCFIYGNHLPALEDQAENQLLPLLMTLNTPHFDFSSCNFTLKHMSRVDSGDGGLSAEGTGRVFYGRHAGVLRSYTLECNYNTGKGMCNHIPPSHGRKGGSGNLASPERKQTSPPKYHPDIWRGVGQGFLKALLDAEGAMVWSRLPLSKFRSLERARKFLMNDLRSKPSYREQSLLLRRGALSTTGHSPPIQQQTRPPPPPSVNTASPAIKHASVLSSAGKAILPSSEKTINSARHITSTTVLEFPNTTGCSDGTSPPTTSSRLAPERRATSHPPLLPLHPGRRSSSSSFANNSTTIINSSTSSSAMRAQGASPRQGSSSNTDPAAAPRRSGGHHRTTVCGTALAEYHQESRDMKKNVTTATAVTTKVGIDERWGNRSSGRFSGPDDKQHWRTERSESFDAAVTAAGGRQHRRREVRTKQVKAAAAAVVRRGRDRGRGGSRSNSTRRSSSSNNRKSSRARRGRDNSRGRKTSDSTPRSARDATSRPEPTVMRVPLLPPPSVISSMISAGGAVRRSREHAPQVILPWPNKFSSSGGGSSSCCTAKERPAPGWE